MIEYTKGDLLKSDVEALVNTVNTVGIMGKGIALQFKQAFPENFRLYQKASKHNEIKMGEMFVFETGRLVNPRYIINFPTKKHWRGQAKINDIKIGLKDLVRVVKEMEIHSIAIPPLGCGNGGLDWKEVRPIIEAAVKELQGVNVFIFEPVGAPKPEQMKVETKRPNLTIGRASLIILISKYAEAGYRLSLLEVQKLAYLLQAFGEPLKLNYEKQKYGPYAENLNFVLQRLEGHYIRGYGDRSRRAEIRLLPGSVEEANVFLNNHRETLTRLEKVSELIHGFESPYGMELLATMVWLISQNDDALNDLGQAIKGFKNWNTRKQDRFKEEHIRVAWEHVKEEIFI